MQRCTSYCAEYVKKVVAKYFADASHRPHAAKKVATGIRNLLLFGSRQLLFLSFFLCLFLSSLFVSLFVFLFCTVAPTNQRRLLLSVSAALCDFFRPATSQPPFPVTCCDLLFASGNTVFFRANTLKTHSTNKLHLSVYQSVDC